MSEKKNKWYADWSGSWPCLCSGIWTLYKNGEKVDTQIPFEEDDAGTYGEYYAWHFDEDYCEEFDLYYDGMNAEAWIKEYRDWLSTFADEDEFEDIFEAFQARDFRSNSCGGCI